MPAPIGLNRQPTTLNPPQPGVLTLTPEQMANRLRLAGADEAAVATFLQTATGGAGSPLQSPLRGPSPQVLEDPLSGDLIPGGAAPLPPGRPRDDVAAPGQASIRPGTRPEQNFTRGPDGGVHSPQPVNLLPASPMSAQPMAMAGLPLGAGLGPELAAFGQSAGAIAPGPGPGPAQGPAAALPQGPGAGAPGLTANAPPPSGIDPAFWRALLEFGLGALAYGSQPGANLGGSLAAGGMAALEGSNQRRTSKRRQDREDEADRRSKRRLELEEGRYDIAREKAGRRDPYSTLGKLETDRRAGLIGEETYRARVKKLTSDSAGGPTLAQRANNSEIDAARRRIAEIERGLEPGVSLGDELQRRMSKVDPLTGLETPDYSSHLARLVWLAQQAKTGGDQQQEAWSRKLSGTTPAAGGLAALPAKLRTRLDQGPMSAADLDALFSNQDLAALSPAERQALLAFAEELERGGR